MQLKLILMAIFLLNIISVNADLENFNGSHLLPENAQLGPGSVSYYQEDISLLQERYEKQVMSISIKLLIFSMLIWIIEPKVKQKFNNFHSENKYVNYFFGDGSIPFVLKWLGIGLIFISGYSIWTLL